uniref:Uncharacterized protein n=1 Tax=Parascaris univalens TaxID=6257 RepID=A0A914ZPL0_PARUN
VVLMNEANGVVFKKDSSGSASANDNNVDISSFKWPPFTEADYSGMISVVIDLSETPNAHKCLKTLNFEVDNGVNKAVMHFNENSVLIRNDDGSLVIFLCRFSVEFERKTLHEAFEGANDWMCRY